MAVQVALVYLSLPSPSLPCNRNLLTRIADFCVLLSCRYLDSHGVHSRHLERVVSSALALPVSAAVSHCHVAQYADGLDLYFDAPTDIAAKVMLVAAASVSGLVLSRV
jgi:hypothetical protein